MWKRVILFVVIFALVIVALLHLDLVHSDPGIPIEDLPFVIAAMACVSWHVFRRKLSGWRAAIPSLVLVCVAFGFWTWARAQYGRAASLRIEAASLVFPGLYFPKDSLRYTYTVLAETKRPHDEVEREILSGLKARGVHVSALRIHFVEPASPPVPPSAYPVSSPSSTFQ